MVCGSRGYGPVRAVVLGGVSRALVDGAPCPVLVLPRAAPGSPDHFQAWGGAAHTVSAAGGPGPASPRHPVPAEG